MKNIHKDERRIIECAELGINSNDIQNTFDIDKLKYYKRDIDLVIEDITIVIDESNKGVTESSCKRIKKKRSWYNNLKKEIKERIAYLNRLKNDEIQRNSNSRNNLFAKACFEFMNDEMIQYVWGKVDEMKNEKDNS